MNSTPAHPKPFRYLGLALAAALVATCLALDAHALDAQQTAPADTLYEVRLTDGTRHVGTIVSETDEHLTLRTVAGTEITIRRENVARRQVAEGRVVEGAFWPRDPNTSRLFFGPTGRTIPQGEGYFAVYELIFSFVGYGATDWLTLAGGTPIVPGLIGEALYLAPKARVYHDERLDISAGILSVFATRDIGTGTVGILYGVGSYGSTDSAVTVGAGWPFYAASGRSDIANNPVLMLGGEHRISRSLKLITENYLITGDRIGALSGGVRFFGERLSADAGLAFGFGEREAECCLPVVNFVYNFGGD